MALSFFITESSLLVLFFSHGDQTFEWVLLFEFICRKRKAFVFFQISLLIQEEKNWLDSNISIYQKQRNQKEDEEQQSDSVLNFNTLFFFLIEAQLKIDFSSSVKDTRQNNSKPSFAGERKRFV